MRRVYQPPEKKPGLVGPIALAALLSLLVFLVLPLTQMVSSGVRKELTLVRVDATQLQAPEDDFEEPPPPPPEEKPPDEPPPQLADNPPPMNLNVNLDVAVGSGGAMAMGLGGFQGSDLGHGLDAFDVSDLERRPEVISQVAPIYPAELRKARIEGSVTVVFVLSEEGRVEDARVENSTRPEFEKPALDAVRRWRFKPGQKDGQAVKTYLRLPIRFSVGAG